MNYLLNGQETKRLIFRKIEATDFNNWLEFHKEPAAKIHWHTAFEAPEIECQKWYDRQAYRYANNLGGMNALVEKSSGRLVGHCGLLVQNVDNQQELEIGYSILPEFWKKGFATESAIKCKNYGFKNNLAASIISIISTTNNPSKNVAIKNGMQLEKTTVYKNIAVEIFRIQKSEWSNKRS